MTQHGCLRISRLFCLLHMSDHHFATKPLTDKLIGMLRMAECPIGMWVHTSLELCFHRRSTWLQALASSGDVEELSNVRNLAQNLSPAYKTLHYCSKIQNICQAWSLVLDLFFFSWWISHLFSVDAARVSHSHGLLQTYRKPHFPRKSCTSASFGFNSKAWRFCMEDFW